MNKIKVFLVDDHEVVITGVEAILSFHNNISIVGTANKGKEALEKILQLIPDVVIMDINLPEISGIEITKIISEKLPYTKVILHTSYIDEKTVIQGFEAGAMGYVPKSFKSNDLIDAIETVYENNKYLKGIISDIVIGNRIKDKTKAEILLDDLSEREIEVIKHIAFGFVNKQIADKLDISLRTVEGHKSNIFKKLKINSTAELVIYAIKNAIIEI